MVGAAEPEQRENEKNKRLQRTRQHMSTFANFFLTKIAQKKLSQAKEFLLTLWGKHKNHVNSHSFVIWQCGVGWWPLTPHCQITNKFIS